MVHNCQNGKIFTFRCWFFFSRRLFVLLWFFLSWSFLFVGEDWIEWFNSLFLRFTFLWWGRLLIFVTRCGVNWIWFLKIIKYEVQRVYGLRIWGFMGRKSIVFNKANWFKSFAAKILTSEVWAPYGRLIWGPNKLLYMALYLGLYMGTDFNRWINNNCHYFFKRSRGHGSPPTQSCIHPCRESILIGPLGCPTNYLG